MMLTKEEEIRLFDGWLEARHIQHTEYSNPPTDEDIEFGAMVARVLRVNIQELPSYSPYMASTELVEGIEARIKREAE